MIGPIIARCAGMFAGSANPISAGATGASAVGRFFAYTMLGRVIIVSILLLATFAYFSNHFTKIERHAWEVTVQQAQRDIVNRVATVNDATRKSQDAARAERSMWQRILAVVTDGIWKVQPPHPIEAETIELINETRGNQHFRKP